MIVIVGLFCFTMGFLTCDYLVGRINKKMWKDAEDKLRACE